MIWIIISAIVSASLSTWLGYKRLIYLYQITLRRFLFAALLGVTVYSLLLYLFKIEMLSEEIAAAIITNTYASVFGFFIGAAFNQYGTRKNSGEVLYCNRSFVSDHLPIIVAIGLILFGVHRSAIFSEMVISPIRLSSGLSLLSIGVWGITLRLVPEFREEGFILIDTIIEWENLVSYQWFGEEILEIEYEQEDAIKSFKTLIPDEDQVEVEKLLSSKMLQKLEED